jgi:hypothetical protein
MAEEHEARQPYECAICGGNALFARRAWVP